MCISRKCFYVRRVCANERNPKFIPENVSTYSLNRRRHEQLEKKTLYSIILLFRIKSSCLSIKIMTRSSRLCQLHESLTNMRSFARRIKGNKGPQAYNPYEKVFSTESTDNAGAHFEVTLGKFVRASVHISTMKTTKKTFNSSTFIRNLSRRK